MSLLPLGWRAVATAEARAAIWQSRAYLWGLGSFGVAAYNASQYLALTTTSLNATLIAASGSVCMTLLSACLHGERPRRRK